MLEDALPRPTRDPEYLLHLRDKALARMAQDEIPTAPRVTRRWSLRHLAMAGTAAVIAPRAFAGTLRNAAPQYGAPGLPGNPPLPRPATFASRSDLGSLDSWLKSSVVLIEDQSSNDSLWGNHPSRTSYYLLPSGAPISLNLITVSSTTFVVSGPEALYVSYAGELYGARFIDDDVILIPSVFKTTARFGEAEAVHTFSGVFDDRAIERLLSPSRQIHIHVGNAPWSGFGIHSVSMAHGILTVEGVAIDLKTRQPVAPQPVKPE